MFLIMAGAFVGQELESEFGKLPPSFLPLGNRRLFKHQVALAPDGCKVYLSIPDAYSLSSTDENWLEAHNVSVLRLPVGLSIGASLVAALNISGHSLNTSLHLLYGDTLYRNLPTGLDIASVSHAKDGYNWAVLTGDDARWFEDKQIDKANGSPKIIDGYFRFSNPRQLIKAITENKWDFLDGLNQYHNTVGIKAVESDHWLDFGHVNTYYRSKAEFTTQRSFNELTITPKWIEKTSLRNSKIAAEAAWFEAIPENLRCYTPQFLGSTVFEGKSTYRLEYLHLTALNELFVFSKLPNHVWQQILTGCIEFLIECSRYEAPKNEGSNSLGVLFGQKTDHRLDEYCASMNIDRKKGWKYNGAKPVSLQNLIEDSNSNLPVSLNRFSVMHGDFCFSNILYDFRAGKVKTIDPRGITPSGEKTIYGDLRYDIAKLSHSILGMYDWIIAGYYDVSILGEEINFTIPSGSQYTMTQQTFVEMVKDEFGLTLNNLYAMQIHLFLSMLPLHEDDPKRQQALFANAFRLHHELVRT